MTHLCLGGGSIRGFCILGALHYLYITNKITKITRFHGCSIGSIIGTLLVLKQTPKEIFDYLLKVDFKKYWDFDISMINSRFSLLGQAIFDFFKEYMSSLEDINITIEDFCNKYDVDFNILTTCINTRNSVIMNKYTFPKTKLIDALIASSSIPILFPPVKIDNFYYIDGSTRVLSGCLDNMLTEDTITIKISDYDCKPEDIKFDSLKDYILSIFKTMLTRELKTTGKYYLTIVVPKEFCSRYTFNDLTSSDKTGMFLAGLKQSECFFRDLQLPITVEESKTPSTADSDSQDETSDQDE